MGIKKVLIKIAKAKIIKLIVISGTLLIAACSSLDRSEHAKQSNTSLSKISQSNNNTEDVAALVRRVRHLEDVGQIQKLQSKYIHLLFTQRFDRIVDEIYAKNAEDVSIEFSDSGVYRGQESLAALYKAFERTKQLPGFFILHMTVNPYIEISDSGLTARSHWLSPGASNGPNGSSWIWGPYYVDYIKENGEWRIHHAQLVPVFRNPYDKSWGEADTHGTVNGILGVEPDAPPTLYRPFNEVKGEKDIFRGHPDLPE